MPDLQRCRPGEEIEDQIAIVNPTEDMSEFRWHRTWHGSPRGRALSRQVTPNVEAHVYMSAHDDKTWVANIENRSTSHFGIDRIKFNFKTRKEALRWIRREIPKMKRLLKSN